MAPLEELQSKDLAWISDFVMQQMVIMLRPMMEHLHETDAACDYAQRMVQRVSMDVSEVRGDLDQTNKYLAILRQGMGVQNEGKCMLQRSLETSTRTVKRLDDQVESMLTVLRGMEDSIRELFSDVQGDKGRQEDLAKQVTASSVTVEDLQDSVLSNEARLDVLQREFRELRRGQLSMVPKLEDKAPRPPQSSQSGRTPTHDGASWPQKKTFAAVEPIGANAPGAAAGFSGSNNLAETSSSQKSGSRQESKKVPPGLRLQPTCPTSATASGLPFLSSTGPIGPTRPADHGNSDPGHRLRFTATMPKPDRS